jgi:hypothetical protein
MPRTYGPMRRQPLVLRSMRIIADFMIVIGVMVMTGAAGVLAAGMAEAIAHVHLSPDENALWVLTIMAGMLGAGMFAAGILVHLRRSQKN